MKFKGIKCWIEQVAKWSSLEPLLNALVLISILRRRQQMVERGTNYLGVMEWGKRFLPNHFCRRPSQMHMWLNERLQNLHLTRGTRINVIGPRGGAKSTIGTMAYALRAALEGWEPYIWIISDTSSQAETHLKNVKAELESNERLARVYPNSCGRGKFWLKEAIELRNGTVIECFGTGQKVRGRRQGEYRPSLIICDDIENDSHIESPRRRELSRTWFQTALVNAGNKETNFLSLATALHRDALAMQLCRTPGWDSAVFRSIVRWPDNMELWQKWEQIYSDASLRSPRQAAWIFYQKNQQAMQAGAEVLWPAEENLYALMKMRVQGGHTAFEREKQSSPIDPERCEWPEEYFEEHIWFDEWPRDLQFKVIALDPSKGRDARHGDYSAFVVLGVDRQGILYVEADLARRPTSQIVTDGVTLHREQRAAAFGVEANQFQELLADEFVKEFARQGIVGCVPTAINNSMNKQTRIRRLGAYLAQRRLRFLRGSSSTQMLVDQLRDFPLGSYDDGPDALEMALRLAEELFHGGTPDDGLGQRLVSGES